MENNLTYNNRTPPKNQQDAFDRACERLLTHFDWGRSGRDLACSYRLGGHPMDGEEDKPVNCCVVGYMIPDWPEIMPAGQYCNASTRVLREQLDKFLVWFKDVSPSFLSYLQGVHDDQSNWESKQRMYMALKATASTYQLKIKPEFSSQYE